MSPLSMTDFAKYVGIPAADVFALPFPAFLALIKKHGFYLTGSGLVPKVYK